MINISLMKKYNHNWQYQNTEILIYVNVNSSVNETYDTDYYHKSIH